MRQEAFTELEKRGHHALPALDNAVQGNPALEMRRRVDLLLHRMEDRPLPACLQQIWAVQALEMIGTAEAGALLERLAGGEPEAWLTGEAKAAWERRAGCYE